MSKNNSKFYAFRSYILGFLTGLLFIASFSYAAMPGAIGDLFGLAPSDSNGLATSEQRLVGANIKDGTITSYELADFSVTSDKIQDGAVNNSALQYDSVISIKIQNETIESADVESVFRAPSANRADFSTSTDSLRGYSTQTGITAPHLDTEINSNGAVTDWLTANFVASGFDCTGKPNFLHSVASDKFYCSTVTPPSPVNGVCGAAVDTCSTGTLVDVADTATDYLWDCNGTGGGTNANCSSPKSPTPPSPVNGACGSSVNSCSAGDFVDVADNASYFLWRCDGTGGGTNANCSVPKPPSGVNGVCGSSVNSCIAGNLVNTPDSASYFLWRCDGTGGGTNANCSRPKPPSGVNGVCGSSVNSCIAGNLVNTPDSASYFLWRCDGTGGGTNANCSRPKPPSSPTCGTAENTCNSGTYSDLPDTPTQYRWRCNGLGGGASIVCTRPKPPVNGKCGTYLNTCISGDPIPTFWGGDIKHIWSCKGRNGGTHDEPCELLKGRCGAARNTCIHGSVSNIGENATSYTWRCDGYNGASGANCSAPKPTGTCTDRIKNQNETGIDCGGVCGPCFWRDSIITCRSKEGKPCSNFGNILRCCDAPAPYLIGGHCYKSPWGGDIGFYGEPADELHCRH